MGRRDPDPEFEFGSGHPATVLSNVKPRRWRAVIVILAVLAAIGAYLYRYQRPLVERAIEQVPAAQQSRTTVYKWRDASGNWTIGDTPPPPGVKYETLHYDSDTNVMPIAPRDR
ncbi:MAG: DUF4124 domain-containing protein [Gammaproteobacteria bacterium]